MQEHIVFAAAVVVALSWCVTTVIQNRRMRKLEERVGAMAWKLMQGSLELNELGHQVHWLQLRVSQLLEERGLPKADSPLTTQTPEDAVGPTGKDVSLSQLFGKG